MLVLHTMDLDSRQHDTMPDRKGGVLLLVDDDPFNRHGMRLYFEQAGFGIREAGSEEEAWQHARDARIDAAIVDLAIPQAPGGQVDPDCGGRLGWHLKSTIPSLGVVFFSAYEDHCAEFLERIGAGVRGVAYKLKGCQPAALLTAVLEAMAGRVLIDGRVQATARRLDAQLGRVSAEELPYVRYAVAGVKGLTPRLAEVARLLARSHTVAGVARELGIAPRTAENYIGFVYERLGLTEMGHVAPHLRKAVVLAKAWAIAESSSIERVSCLSIDTSPTGDYGSIE